MKPDVYETFDRYHENKILHPTSSVVVDHTARILDLEKQVADLRAALEEHLNPRTRKPRKGVNPNIYGSMLHD